MAQIQDMSYRWICGSGSYSSTNKKSDSLLLKLPVDILLIIHSFLPTGKYTSVPFSQLPVAKKREYKMLVVRQFPNAWLTGRTLRFREFHAKDLCPQLKGLPYKDQPGWNKDTLRQFEEGALLIKHEHVQMSLKYDRLEKKPPSTEVVPQDPPGAISH
ncbi:hypothetical protein FoTM2_001612 [Fusarium oxysporum f. sp. vasinfectum]|nr:hypothetical protein FoTM2_001612 [Fusarium oxysporum f. sp. vasinfectum]